MTLILKENEVCPYAMKCKYNENNTCYGANSSRLNTFTCEFVDQQGNISENGCIRNSLDKTGKMKVIMEG